MKVRRWATLTALCVSTTIVLSKWRSGCRPRSPYSGARPRLWGLEEPGGTACLVKATAKLMDEGRIAEVDVFEFKGIDRTATLGRMA